MLMNHLSTKFTIVVSTLIVLSIACSNAGNNDDESNLRVDTSDIADTAVNKLTYPLPTPLEITHLLNKAGAIYNYNFSNSNKNVDKYFTEGSRALNLGIYGSDLSYSASYNKSQETMDYYLCTKKLQDAMDIQTPYHQSVSERIENNIDNQDSLYSILTSSFKNTFEYLNDNGKGSISALILAGGWIEGLYISCKLAEVSTDNAGIYQAIASQKETLGILIKLLETYKDHQKVAEISDDLQKIKYIYDKLEIVNGRAQLSSKNYLEIKKEIEKIREKIVETT
jgi:hypothetical protein